ncbi:FAD-binding oxidoreductase [Bradyrhizobium erythrophlei]|uniref:FAD/FMN-containing dehydrogenase n=1 Tax=Bradyrhizobium erythrophlei TaxID=1437360 RepID=A0A1M5NXG2_9BRAD|nr:FAD-binding oxidoreductase [Bradyrhizobium erythrophlei]SHG93859.1 FAD/FMN-containing dehydrogenase [Bradyrhizobium erythrophlei]
MTDLIESTLRGLGGQLPGRTSRPGDDRYAAATAIWAKPVGLMPRMVVHCRTMADIRLAIAAARSAGLALSVRGGGHDWAGRALCDGLVLDLRGMRDVHVSPDRRSARISGGARAVDVLTATDPLGLAAVTGSCSAVGMAGLTLGGGYGPLIGRFGLALDNLIAADIVLADGRIVTAEPGNEEDLFWALRGGGGNFGVVAEMRIRLHELPNVVSGVLVYPFSEARTVLRRFAEIAPSLPDELTVQVCAVAGPDGAPVILLVPTWSGRQGGGDAHIAPLLKLGTLLDNSVDAVRYGASLSVFDPFIVNGQRVFMETCSLPVLNEDAAEILVEAMAKAVSAGCAILTHEFRGAASRVPVEATAFGLRRDHMLIEILASFPDRSDRLEERRHRHWVRDTRQTFKRIAFPGGYPNLLGAREADRAAASFGPNAERLAMVKRRYDPGNAFSSAIPLPPDQNPAAVEQLARLHRQARSAAPASRA